MVSALDSQRARALVTRDPALLTGVYAGDSPALATDRSTIRRLADRGWRVADARHRVRSARRLAATRPGIVRIRVVDELPSYPVTDATGTTVGSTPPRAAAASVLELVRIGEGYRIRTVEQV